MQNKNYVGILRIIYFTYCYRWLQHLPCESNVSGKTHCESTGLDWFPLHCKLCFVVKWDLNLVRIWLSTQFLAQCYQIKRCKNFENNLSEVLFRTFPISIPLDMNEIILFFYFVFSRVIIVFFSHFIRQYQK